LAALGAFAPYGSAIRPICLGQALKTKGKKGIEIKMGLTFSPTRKF